MMQHAILLAQQTPQMAEPNPVVALFMGLVYLALLVLVIAGMWKMFEKAGQPGWGAIVPIYNLYLLLKIAGRPGWWLILMFIPCVGFIIMIVVCLDVAKNFGKDSIYGLGLAFLGFIFFPLLGFGNAVYRPATDQRGFPVT
jgi:hypothetical protein